jgi:hypothetical protein
MGGRPRSSPHQPPATRPFTQLKLLNRPANESALGIAEHIRIRPWQGKWTLALLKKMLIPGFLERRNRSLSKCGPRHCAVVVEYFAVQSQTHSVLSIDQWFLPSLELFIAEEQCHSRLLGRFLDRERIPRLNSHWVDGVFRQLRKLAGLEVCVMVLVTAEVLAVPFYQALHDATRSQLLRSICKRILCDEAAHLDYQALTLGLIRRPLSSRARGIRVLCHSILFHCTALLLWHQHHVVFRAAGWDFRRFWAQARRGFARLQLKIWRLSLDGVVLAR